MCAAESAKVVLTRSEHNLSRRRISASALKVLYRLNRQGKKAYLVGGGVRDLLLGRKPKDFDIATDARPEQVRRMFRNSRIVGRRFRLVHVMFHDGVVEVSTFRGAPDPRHQKRSPGDLLVTSDNTYGSPREDAFRRDFTINALFYRVDDFSVIDYVGGLEDLEAGQLRVIGDPYLRFPEDPVRMMRACEMAGRLNFQVHSETQAAIWQLRREIEKASPYRLIEEILQLLRCGRCMESVEWMRTLGLSEILLPQTEATWESEILSASSLLAVLDQRHRDGDRLDDSTMLSVLLLPQIVEGRAELDRRRRGASRGQLVGLIEEAVSDFGSRAVLSQSRSLDVFRILETFQRLCEPDVSHATQLRVATRPSFSAALRLFELVVEATGSGDEGLELWRSVAREAPQPRRRRESTGARRSRRRRGPRRRTARGR